MKKQIKKKDLILKIFSGIIAITLWFYVVQVQSPDMTRTIKNVPVAFNQLASLKSKNLILMTDQEYTVDVKISGPRKYAMEVDRDNLIIRADVSTLEKAGKHVVQTNIILPYSNLEVINKNPSALTVDVDHLTTQTKPVEILTEGAPKDSYVIGNLTSNVQSVSITGPKTILDGVKSVAAKINVNGKSSDTAGMQPLVVVDTNDKVIKSGLLEYTPESIEVHAEILRSRSVRIKPKFTAAFEHVAEDYILDENSIKEIRIAGVQALVDTLNEIETKPIGPEDISETGEVSIQLNLPQGVRSLDGDTLALRFSKKPQ